MIRHPYTPEYTGSVFTSCQPISNYDRLAIYILKRGEVPFYRALPQGERNVTTSTTAHRHASWRKR